MTRDAFDLFRPRRPDTATVFASPHSGREYPADFVRQSPLDHKTLRSSEDAFVDLLFGAAPEHGAPLLAARAPRAWVDLNRACDELDPALIEGMGRGALNPRVASGLGVIPRVVAGGRVIHPGRIPMAEAEARLAAAWRPYHAALQDLLREARMSHGAALLIDCHSMPHEAIAAHTGHGRIVPEVVLGDRHGAACAAQVMEGVEAAFRRAGFRVARNTPFAGAYVSQAYGRPSIGQHVVQVEIDRRLYMDESRVTPGPAFDTIRRRLSQVVAELAALGRGLGSTSALAAE
jgi:N-formylglutamate amidohydrolase